MLPDEMVALHCQSAESDGAGLDSKGSELQELLKIDGEIGVCHGCGTRSRHLAQNRVVGLQGGGGGVVVVVMRNGTDREGNNWSDEHRGGDDYWMLL